jgi:hypothetical protein
MKRRKDTINDTSPRMTRADFLVLAGGVALNALLFWRLWRPGRQGSSITLTTGDGRKRRFSLAQQRTLKVGGPLGDSVIRIEYGRARFVSSPCRNKDCVHYGWISNQNDMAACLPNKVLIAVQGGDEGFDAINS